MNPAKPFFSATLPPLWRVAASGGAPAKLSAAEEAAAESPHRVWSADGRRVAWLRGGNVFLRDASQPRQLTRTGDATELLTFAGADEIAYRAGERVLAVDLASGRARLVATLESADPRRPAFARARLLVRFRRTGGKETIESPRGTRGPRSPLHRTEPPESRLGSSRMATDALGLSSSPASHPCPSEKSVAPDFFAASREPLT